MKNAPQDLEEEVIPDTMKQKKPSTASKLFLVDGHSFCYRAYYAIRNLTNSLGEPTNAIYGFISMLQKLVQEYGPDHLAICFDHEKPTFRHVRYKEYKANRSPMPEDLVQQIEPIKELCRAYRYAIFEAPGYEADDVIGTLAMQAERKGYDVFIITGDKDAMQLVDDRIRVLNPHKEGLVIDRDGVRKRFEGLGPEKVVDVMALMGDASDNIPGVPGVGEKTAVKLIQEFGSVENLMDHVTKIKSKRQQDLLKQHREDALLSKELARIDTHVPLDIQWDDLAITVPDEEKLVRMLKRFEFRSMLRGVETRQPVKAAGERHYQTISELTALEELAAVLGKAGAFAFDTETTSADPMRASLVGMSFSWKQGHAAYVAVAGDHQGPGIRIEEVRKILKPLLENPRIEKWGQNIKYDWIVMHRHQVALKGLTFDTMIASHLLNPLKLNHNLDDISLDYLGISKIPTESLLGKGKAQITMDLVPLEKIAEYASEDADCVFRLKTILETKLAEKKLSGLFRDVEMPLMEVLARVEMNGVFLDVKFLKELSDKAGSDLEALTAKIYEDAGEEFNINSTRQLAEIFFVKKKFPAVKKTKTGFSTDVSVLEKLAVQYELPKLILDYREKAKLKSTYLDALPEMINPETHAVHTSYHQTTTVTGRLSSSDPNLQNIPIKTEEGREIRKAFVPRPWGKGRGRILSADYSQIELRILAHFSGDEHLRRAFQEDRDIHNFTATLLYGIPEGEVNREMRNVAKTINFSIIYGKSAYGLSQDLGISVGEADAFIKSYFARYAGIRDFLESQKEKARRQGYLTTLLGRHTYFPDIQSKNVQLRQFAERAAINAPIQGSAADLIKLAMLTIQNRLEENNFKSLMVMQVHDELVFDGPESEMDALKGLVKQGMEGALALEVPLRVDVTTGASWYKN